MDFLSIRYNRSPELSILISQVDGTEDSIFMEYQLKTLFLREEKNKTYLFERICEQKNE